MKVFVISIALLIISLPVLAVTYTWEDDQGTVNFTEDLGNVPTKYRKKVKVVGEEDLLPAESDTTVDKTPVKAKVKGAGGAQEGALPAKQFDMKAVYGDKDAAAWKAEYEALDADVKAAEKQLVEYRNRLKDTSTMSRSEYLSIQATIHSIENNVVMRRQKLEELKQQAADAGVPSGLME
jgi:Domain of unknown function (DUF4124)